MAGKLCDGPLAQLVEQQTFNLRVVGSIPTRLTIKVAHVHIREMDVRFYYLAIIIALIQNGLVGLDIARDMLGKCHKLNIIISQI